MPEQPSLESTATLLGKVQRGDTRAQEVLFTRFLPILQRWAHGRLPGFARGTVDTNDLVQVTLLRAMKRLKAFEPRREGAFLAYLRRILLNRLRDEIRETVRRPGQESLDEEVESSSPEAVEVAIGKEMVERYEAALESLDARQREAVILRIEFGYTHAQVAEAIEAPSANAARMVVARALLRLAQVLDE